MLAGAWKARGAWAGELGRNSRKKDNVPNIRTLSCTYYAVIAGLTVLYGLYLGINYLNSLRTSSSHSNRRIVTRSCSRLLYVLKVPLNVGAQLGPTAVFLGCIQPRPHYMYYDVGPLLGFTTLALEAMPTGQKYASTIVHNSLLAR